MFRDGLAIVFSVAGGERVDRVGFEGEILPGNAGELEISGGVNPMSDTTHLLPERSECCPLRLAGL